MSSYSDANQRRNRARDRVRKSNLPRVYKELLRYLLDAVNSQCEYTLAWKSQTTIKTETEYGIETIRRVTRFFEYVGLFEIYDCSRSAGIARIKAEYGYDCTKGKYNPNGHRFNIYRVLWQHPFWQTGKVSDELVALALRVRREGTSLLPPNPRTPSRTPSPESRRTPSPERDNAFKKLPSPTHPQQPQPSDHQTQALAPPTPSLQEAGGGGLLPKGDDVRAIIITNITTKGLELAEQEIIAAGGEPSKRGIGNLAKDLLRKLGVDAYDQLTPEIILRACQDHSWKDKNLEKLSVGLMVSQFTDSLCGLIRSQITLAKREAAAAAAQRESAEIHVAMKKEAEELGREMDEGIIRKQASESPADRELADRVNEILNNLEED